MHTPGPWTIVPRDVNLNGFAVHSSIEAESPEGSRALALVMGAEVDDSPEIVANARLISAAPDYYATAELAIACMAMEGDHKDHDAPCWLDALTIAHAKATEAN